MLSELRLRTRSDVLIGPRKLDASSVLRAVTFTLLKSLGVECAMCVVAPSTQRRLVLVHGRDLQKGDRVEGQAMADRTQVVPVAGLPQRGVEKGIRVNAPGAE
eukprot:597284-Amphidinium_carterae.1